MPELIKKLNEHAQDRMQILTIKFIVHVYCFLNGIIINFIMSEIDSSEVGCMTQL